MCSTSVRNKDQKLVGSFLKIIYRLLHCRQIEMYRNLANLVGQMLKIGRKWPMVDCYFQADISSNIGDDFGSLANMLKTTKLKTSYSLHSITCNTTYISCHKCANSLIINAHNVLYAYNLDHEHAMGLVTLNGLLYNMPI